MLHPDSDDSTSHAHRNGAQGVDSDKFTEVPQKLCNVPLKNAG